MFISFTTSTSGSVKVGVASTLVLAANPGRKYFLLCNDSSEDIYISFGATAVLNAGLKLCANGGVYDMSLTNMQFTGAIYAISASGDSVTTDNLTYIEA